jgi:hypothetical protein
MAENKKSFVLYTDTFGLIKQLPDEVAGRLLKHIYSYVNDENPITDELLLNIAFEPIKAQLKRDLVKWENQLKQRSEAGKKSAEQRALTKFNERSISYNEIQRNSTDNVNDNVNVNVIINNIEDRKLKFASTLEIYLSIYGKDLLNEFYKYWTEPNKSNTKFKQELEKTWSLERRLETWSKNDKNFNNNNNTKNQKNEQLRQLSTIARTSNPNV